MEKWNFDVLFVGDMEEQIGRVSRFLGGSKQLAAATEKEFADHVMGGDDKRAQTAYDAGAELNEALAALEKDPRCVEVVRASHAERDKEVADEVVARVRELLNR